MTGTYVMAALVLAAVVLGSLAYNYQGSPRMDDKAAVAAGRDHPESDSIVAGDHKRFGCGALAPRRAQYTPILYNAASAP